MGSSPSNRKFRYPIVPEEAVSSALLSEATDQSARKQDLARSVRLAIPRTARGPCLPRVAPPAEPPECHSARSRHAAGDHQELIPPTAHPAQQPVTSEILCVPATRRCGRRARIPPTPGGPRVHLSR